MNMKALYGRLVGISIAATLGCSGTPGSDDAGMGNPYETMYTQGPGTPGASPIYPQPGAAAPGAAPTGVPSAPDAVADEQPGPVAPPAGLVTTADGFLSLAPALGAPLDPTMVAPLNPPPPDGWVYFPIEGAVCRDGSPTGIYVRFGTGEGLLWYLEGGGACTSPGFCNYNPASANMALAGDGQTVLGSALGAIPARQQPGVFEGGALNGIFDTMNPENPFADWSMIYTPYCTGDVHFGTRPNGSVPGVAQPQQFVGHYNMVKFAARIVPTFRDQVDRVVLTGASAGAFGTALNFSMVQDTFSGVPVDAILDSGIPFTDAFMPPCLQQYWRDTWGLNDALPPDCEQCFRPDGGGMLGLADFLMAKHPAARIAGISSMQDEVIRLFFSAGLNDCATATTADPVAITMGQFTPGTLMEGVAYSSGLDELRAIYGSTGRLATYYIAGAHATHHQHTWRHRFYEPVAGGISIASFVAGFLSGDSLQIGP